MKIATAALILADLRRTSISAELAGCHARRLGRDGQTTGIRPFEATPQAMGTMTIAPRPTGMADDLSRYVHHEQGWAQHVRNRGQGRALRQLHRQNRAGVSGVPGVASARLNLSTGKLCGAGQPRRLTACVLRRVRDLGYEAQPFEAGADPKPRQGEGRLLLRCLAVSGFAHGLCHGPDRCDLVWRAICRFDAPDLLLAGGRLPFPLPSMPASPFSAPPGAASCRPRQHGRADQPALLLSLGLSLYQTAGGARTPISTPLRC